MANFVDGLIFVPARSCVVVHVVAHIFPHLWWAMPKQPPLLGVLEGVECLKRIIDEARGLVEAHRGLN